MAPTFPTTGPGPTFQPRGGPLLPSYLGDQPFRHTPGNYDPLPKYLRDMPFRPASERPTTPGRVPVIPLRPNPNFPTRIPYGLLARLLTRNPYMIAAANLLDIYGKLEALPVTSLTKGHYDMSGWILDCSAPSGANWDKVTGIGPFGPPPLPCPVPLLVPAESYGADLNAAGGSVWTWIAFGPGTLGGIRMDGEEQWRRILPSGPSPEWVQGVPSYERGAPYNPYQPETWPPDQPIVVPPVPYNLIPDRQMPDDQRNSPPLDYGNYAPPGGLPDNTPGAWAPGYTPGGLPADKPKVVRRNPWHPYSPPDYRPDTQVKPKPGKKPREKPRVIFKPKPLPGDGPADHPPVNPGVRVKERKHTPSNYNAWKKAADKILSIYEALDLLGAIYQALPWQVRSFKGRDGKWRDKDATPQDKLKRLWDNIDKLDMAQVVKNIAANQLEDKVFGTLGNISKKGTKNLVDQDMWNGLLGLQGGPGF